MGAEPAVDLSAPGRYHIVGVGGSGMSAIAEVLRAMGHEVSGSDLRASPPLERLATLGRPWTASGSALAPVNPLHNVPASEPASPRPGP